MSGPVVLVVNPMSGAGRTGRRLDELASLATSVFGEADVRPTRSLGDGARLAREAAEEGAPLVIAVGGDGTANEVIDGLMAGPEQRPDFGLVPAGTGSDLVKTLGMPPGWPEALATIRRAAPRPCDVVKGTFAQRDGTEVVRHGINVVGVGMAGDVVRRANESSKRLGGRLTFLKATLASFFAWKAPEVTLRWTDEDGQEGTWTGLLANAFINNGRHCGGGMLTGPSAAMDDGLFDVVIVPRLSVPRMIWLTPKLYDGSIENAPGVHAFRASQVEVVSRDPAIFVPCDIDGEQPGGVPLTLSNLPGAIDIRAPFSPAPRPRR